MDFCILVKSTLQRRIRNSVKQLRWSLTDCNGIRTHNHLVRKRTLNHLAKFSHLASLAKWLSVRLQTCGFESCCSHLNFRYLTLASSEEFLDIQQNYRV